MIAPTAQHRRRSLDRPVAILGGAFDPVTSAHVEIAHQVAKEGFRVVVMPCSDTHAFGKRMLPAVTRLELLRLALPLEFEICTLEIEMGLSRAIDSWPAAEKLYGSVHWIIGSDNAECMDHWHEGERLVRELPFIVIGRGGRPLSPKGSWCLQHPHRFLEGDRTCSSTLARAAVESGRWEEAARLIPASVVSEIRRRGLYVPR